VCSAAEIRIHESNFDNGTDGWTVGELFSIAHGALPQNPGGFLQTEDIYGFNAFRAPSEWLGNQSGLLGGSLQIRERIQSSDGVAYPLVVIAGGGIRLQYRTPPPGTDWSNFVVPLRANSGWEVADGSGDPGIAATDAQFRDVLSKIEWLGINADWKTGTDLVGLDHVSVSIPNSITLANPEPSAMILAASGLLLTAYLKGRSRRYSGRRRN
jgi:hypothetical protein